MKKYLSLAILFSLVLSYQNCSIYESEGVQYFNEHGVQVYQQEQQKIASQCNNLDSLTIENLFSTNATQIYNSNGSCKIIVENKNYICGINPNYSVLFETPELAADMSYDIIQHELLLPLSDFQQIIFYSNKTQKVTYASLKMDSQQVWYCETDFASESLEEDVYYLSQILLYLQ